MFGPNGSYQSILKEVDVPILDNTDCENRLKQTRLGAAFVLHRSSFMCAGGEAGKDACTVSIFILLDLWKPKIHTRIIIYSINYEIGYIFNTRKTVLKGDGGAPLVCQRASGQWEVAGIVAWGIGCATPGVPGVYTNVFNFQTWISNTILANL